MLSVGVGEASVTVGSTAAANAARLFDSSLFFLRPDFCLPSGGHSAALSPLRDSEEPRECGTGLWSTSDDVCLDIGSAGTVELPAEDDSGVAR